MSGLVQWNEIEEQIALAGINKDIPTLKKFQAALGSKEFRKQIDGSIRAINKCEKYKIRIEMLFGDYYKNLHPEKGGDFQSLTDLTTAKQQAEQDIGKSRVTINKYVRMAKSIEQADEILEAYEADCNNREIEMSSAGFLKFARTEQHKEAEKIMGLERNTFERYKYLSSLFEIFIRIKNLSWSHHFEVASLKTIEIVKDKTLKQGRMRWSKIPVRPQKSHLLQWLFKTDLK
jgi:vacuolar-type H+-ATPase subunit H